MNFIYFYNYVSKPLSFHIKGLLKYMITWKVKLNTKVIFLLDFYLRSFPWKLLCFFLTAILAFIQYIQVLTLFECFMFENKLKWVKNKSKLVVSSDIQCIRLSDSKFILKLEVWRVEFLFIHWLNSLFILHIWEG